VSAKPIIECVLNISEGRNREFLDRLYDKLNSVEGCRLAHYDEGYDVNRTVITLIGEVGATLMSVEVIVVEAQSNLDIADHDGEHPRVGILDVIPFVVLKDVDKDELRLKIENWSQTISSKYNLPIIFYGKMATQANAITLAQIRKGGIEKLEYRVEKKEITLDFGSLNQENKLGVSCVTIRDIMVAFNINLNTTDLSIAKKVANDLKVRRKYDRRLKDVRFLAWWMKSFGYAQISTNIYDTTAISMIQLYHLVKEVAAKYDLELRGSELIGLTTEYAIAHDVVNLDDAIRDLGLSSIRPFHKGKRLLNLFPN